MREPTKFEYGEMLNYADSSGKSTKVVFLHYMTTDGEFAFVSMTTEPKCRHLSFFERIVESSRLARVLD